MSLFQKVSLRREKHILIAKINGSFCNRTAAYFQEQIRENLSRARAELLIDLSDTNYLVPASVRAIVECYELVAPQNNIVVCSKSTLVKNLLEFSYIPSLVDVLSSFEDAYDRVVRYADLNTLKSSNAIKFQEENSDNVTNIFDHKPTLGELAKNQDNKIKIPKNKSSNFLGI